MLGLVLGPPVQDRHEYIEQSPVKGHKDGQKIEATLIGGEACSVGKEKAKRRSYQCVEMPNLRV